MTGEIVERVMRSSRYRDVDPSLLERLAAEELPRSRGTDDAVKRVKRRLHQAVGAFRGATPRGVMSAIAASWTGDMRAPAFRAACADALRSHASTAERAADLDRFYDGIWSIAGVPARVLDIGCGLGPLALPWMGLPPEAHYTATDVDRRPLATVRDFLELVGQPHEVRLADAVADPPTDAADVALALKLVTTLDRQDPEAATQLVRASRAEHVAVSLPRRSLGGRGKGMERTYRERIERLAAEAGRVSDVIEASVPNELVFVLRLDPIDG